MNKYLSTYASNTFSTNWKKNRKEKKKQAQVLEVTRLLQSLHKHWMWSSPSVVLASPQKHGDYFRVFCSSLIPWLMFKSVLLSELEDVLLKLRSAAVRPTEFRLWRCQGTSAERRPVLQQQRGAGERQNQDNIKGVKDLYRSCCLEFGSWKIWNLMNLLEDDRV